MGVSYINMENIWKNLSVILKASTLETGSRNPKPEVVISYISHSISYISH